jgi:beta-galactosidase/beta-glucuronidase
MYGCSALAQYIDAVLRADYIDAGWGGVWGHVLLEARADAWLSDLYVQPDVAHSSCACSATLNGQADLADGVKLEVLDANGHRVAEATMKPDAKRTAARQLCLKALLPGVRLWSPDSPTLYTARLTLQRGGKVLDAVESRFGMRQFSVDGPHLLLNGKRLMLCGYGDHHIYPEQMAMPSDKEVHLKRLRTIKSYGFNHVRHHSTIMPPEYYDACDEVGIISMAEFPICYEEFLPEIGPVWKRHVPVVAAPTAALETYKRE